MTVWTAGGIGLTLALMNLYGWRWGIATAARIAAGGRPGAGMPFLAMLFLAKLPLVVLGGVSMMKRPAPLPTAFLIGFGSVYCALFAWGLAESKVPR